MVWRVIKSHVFTKATHTFSVMFSGFFAIDNGPFVYPQRCDVIFHALQ